MDVDRKLPIAPTSTNNGDLRHSTRNADSTATTRNDNSLTKDTTRPQTPNLAIINKEPPQSPRNYREDKQSRVEKVMPPPSAPSQTLSAQELRETAKQSITNRPDKADDRIQNGSANASPVPRRRSPSPPTRPGTRNGSADSRASGGRPRSDRGSGDGNDRLDDKRSSRDSRQESHNSSLGRRDGRSERSGRERGSVREAEKDKEAEKDRDRDRIRDRHGDKEKERDRDKDKDRRERDRERDRERERDRDRDRDRHRRDDKDRDRDVRKERDPGGRETPTSAVPPGPDSRGLPTRPDASRHRDVPNGDEALGKRRRPADDEVSCSSRLFAT
jgi:THO complex subunit 2